MATVIGTDYTKRGKDVLAIKLPDGEGGGFDLFVMPPTKGAYDKLCKLAHALDEVMDGEVEAGEFDFDAAMETVAAIMSRNTVYRQITPKFLESIGFDLEDVGDFVASYIFFITKLVESKN